MTGKLNQQLNQLTAQFQQLQRNIQGISGTAGTQAVQSFNKMTHAAHGTQSVLQQLVSSFGRIAVFSVAAGLIVRGFFAITQAIKDTIAEGIRFNAAMEQGQLSMAAILGSTRDVVDAQGKLVEVSKALPFLLEKAASMQREVLLADVETLGTGEELLKVFEQVLALSGTQLGTDKDRLEVAKMITNIGKIAALQGEMLTFEARQIFTLDSARGQEVLRRLGIDIKEARVLKEQGLLLQEILKQGEAYSAIVDLIRDSWEGLTTTIQTFFSLIAGAAFADIFKGMKDILRGFGEELEKIEKRGGLKVAFDMDTASLKKFGQDLAQLTVDFVKGMAEMTKAMIEFSAKTAEFIKGANAVISILGTLENIITFLITKKLFLVLASQVDKLILVFKSLSRGSLALISPLGLVATAIGLIVVAMSELDEAGAIFNEFTSGAVVNVDKLKQELQDILAAQGIEGLRAKIEEFKAIIGALPPDMAALVLETDKWLTSATAMGGATKFNTESLLEFDKMMLQFRKTTGEVDKAMETARKSLIAQTKALQIENEELAKAAKGLISLEEALLNAEERQNALKTGSEEAAKAFRKVKEEGLAYRDTAEELNRLIEDQIKLVDNWKEAQDRSVAAIEADTQALIEETNIINRSIAVGMTAIQIEDELTRAKLTRIAAVDGLTEAEKEAIDVQMAVISANREAQKSLDQLRDSTEQYLISFADIQDIFHEVVIGIARGTSDLGDIFRRAGAGLGASLIEGILVGKKRLEGGIGQNLNALFGLGPGGILGTFAQGGMLGGKALVGGFSQFLFGSAGLGHNLNMAFQSILHGDLAGLWGSTKAAFNNLGVVGAGLIGAGLAEGFKAIFGIGGTLEASIGGGIGGGIGAAIGSIWGPVGTAIGSFLGDLLGSVFGGLFAHVPTKGTQIRTAVVDWLRDLDVVFAEEISRKKYGFEWTKDFMEQTGMEFLEASKQFIPENFPDIVAEDLVPKLRALGLVITSDMAEELGKSLEQTSVTFANMIAENLVDPEKINEFITDLIAKGEFGFAGMVDKINEAFEEGRIGQELYEEAIMGTIDLFLTDLPGSIDVAKIALESFTEEGIFSLEIFQEKMEEVVENVKTIGEAAGAALSQSIAEGLTPEETQEAFLEMIKSVLREAAITEFITDFMDVLFKGLDLTQPIELGSEAMEELADRVQEGAEWLHDMLKAAGLLPKALEEAEEVVEEIEDTTKDVSENLEKWEEAIYDAIIRANELGVVLHGLTTPELEDIADFAEELSSQIESGFSQGVWDAFQSGGVEAATAQFGANLYNILLNSILNALWAGFAAQILMPLLEPVIAGFAFAAQQLINGEITAAEYAVLINATLAMIPDILSGATPIFEDWLRIAQEIADELGEAFTAAGIPTAPQAPPAGGPSMVGGVPSTEQFNQELDNAEDAIEQFIESLDDTTNALQDLVDAYLELLQTIEEGMPPEAVPPEQQPAQLAAILETLLGWMILLVPAFEDLGLDMEILYNAIAAITRALEEFYLTGGFTEETLLELQVALQAVLDAIVENAAALQQWLIQMGYTANLITQIIGYLELAIDTINKMLGEDVPGLPDAQKAFIEEIQELVDEFVAAGEVTSDLSEEVEDLIDEYNTLKTTLIENEELILATLEALGMSTELFNEWMIAIEESFIKQMEDLIDEIYEVDSVWEDLHDTLITSLTVAKALNDALKEGTITQEQYEKFMKQVLIETIRAVSNELQDLQEMADDLVESFDDFIESGEDVSDLQQDLNDLSDEYLQAVKDLRENFVLFILAGGNVREELAALQAAFEKQARAIGAALMEEIAGPAVEAIDEFNKKMAGTFDTFADLSDTAGAAIARFQEAFEAGDMELAVELAEDAVQAQIAFIEKIDELRVAFEEFIASLDEDIQSLIDEGRTLEEQIADRQQRIAEDFATFAGLSFEDQLVAAEDIRNAILEQFDLQKQLQQQILDDKIAELEATRDANIEKINEEREAQRELLQTDLDSINERIRAHEDATARIAQIDEEIARLQIQIQQDELRTAIDIINERIRVVEDAEQTRLRLEEDTANELNRIREQTLDEQIRMAESFRDAAESIRAAIDDILLSEVSPFTPIQRLTEAQRQFAELVGLARGGDVEAARALGGAAQTLLGEASAVFASSTPFQDIFRETIKTMEELGLQFEQDAQLIELQIINDTLDDIEGAIILTGEETIEELIRMRDTLQDQLKALDKTPQQQIDALEEERRILVAGLEGNIEELINTRDTLQGELEDLDATFQLKIDEEMAAFDKVVEEQTDAFDLIIQGFRDAAITELGLLKGYAESSKTALENIERKALVDLQKLVLDIGTAIQIIVDEQIARTDLNEVFSWAFDKGGGQFRQALNEVFPWAFDKEGGQLRQMFNDLYLWQDAREWDRARYLASFYSGIRIRQSFQGGGFIPPGITMPATLHGGARGEIIMPISSNGGRGGSVFEIDYERLGAVVAEAISNRGGPSQINIPIEVRTEDGEMLIRRTIKRLSDESPSGKIFIDSRAVGKYRR